MLCVFRAVKSSCWASIPAVKRRAIDLRCYLTCLRLGSFIDKNDLFVVSLSSDIFTPWQLKSDWRIEELVCRLARIIRQTRFLKYDLPVVDGFA
jgi:hypothetical protein